MQWNTCSDKLNLYLHYETNPYITQKKFKKQNESFINEYITARNGFFDFVNGQNLNNWVMKKYPLMIASVNFDKNITFGELNNKIEGLADDMSTIIDEWVELYD
ncbi:hypothetical protein [Methanococcoides sp. NM1]|uniref:hypothetical protein n=1 Tax=Methanococcoides sp. NM1 TaxID=1201013 RepID=UPI001082DD10|nr:hypothetical protein [Methanococcoides sp. NM1]